MTPAEKKRLWANFIYLPVRWAIVAVLVLLIDEWGTRFPQPYEQVSSDQWFHFTNADVFCVLVVVVGVPVFFALWNFRVIRDFVTYRGNRKFARLNALILCWPYLALAAVLLPRFIRDAVIQQRQKDFTVQVHAAPLPGAPDSTSVLSFQESGRDTVYLLTGNAVGHDLYYQQGEISRAEGDGGTNRRATAVNMATLHTWSVVGGNIYSVPDYHFMLDSARAVITQHTMLAGGRPGQRYVYDTVIHCYLKGEKESGCFAFTLAPPDKMNLVNICADRGKVLATIRGYAPFPREGNIGSPFIPGAYADRQGRVYIMVWDDMATGSRRYGLAFIACFSGSTGKVYQVVSGPDGAAGGGSFRSFLCRAITATCSMAFRNIEMTGRVAIRCCDSGWWGGRGKAIFRLP